VPACLGNLLLEFPCKCKGNAVASSAGEYPSEAPLSWTIFTGVISWVNQAYTIIWERGSRLSPVFVAWSWECDGWMGLDMSDAQRFEAISQRFDAESSVKGIRKWTRQHKKDVFLNYLKNPAQNNRSSDIKWLKLLKPCEVIRQTPSLHKKD